MKSSLLKMREMSDKVKRLEAEVADLKARLLMLEARPIRSDSHFHFPPTAVPLPPAVAPIYGPLERPGTAAPWRNLPEIICFAGLPEERMPR